jgi:hypothetical protein
MGSRAIDGIMANFRLIERRLMIERKITSRELQGAIKSGLEFS